MNIIRRFDIWVVERLYPWLREMWGKYAFPVKMFKRWKRCKDKLKAERQAMVRFWTDILCQAGENAVHAGQFSREQINDWYSVFGKNAGLTDLLPKNIALTRRDMRDLKSAILKRIGPEAREAYRERKNGKTKSLTAKAIRYQFRRAFRTAA